MSKAASTFVACKGGGSVSSKAIKNKLQFWVSPNGRSIRIKVGDSVAMFDRDGLAPFAAALRAFMDAKGAEVRP